MFDSLIWAPEVQKLIVALGVWVIVHNIHVGLRIVVIHLVVPGDGVCTAYETAIDERQFPIFAIVYLSAQVIQGANHMARLVSGRQVAQLRFLRTGFAGWVRLASLLLSCAVSIESMAIFAESADAMVGTSVTCFFLFRLLCLCAHRCQKQQGCQTDL